MPDIPPQGSIGLRPVRITAKPPHRAPRLTVLTARPPPPTRPVLALLTAVNLRPMKILIATNNPAKVREIHAVLATCDQNAPVVQWLSLSDLPSPIPEPEESTDPGATFLQNATLKATYYARMSHMWALADDSGLEVDALHGEPGVHSAYFDRAAAHLPRAARDAANNAKLVAAVQHIPIEQRTARYHCVMVLAGEDGVLETAHGLFEGLILDQPRGPGGFGYDPYFLIPDLQMTAAELSADHKNRISHRGMALRAMSEQIEMLLTRSNQ